MAKLYTGARPVDGTGRFEPAPNTHQYGIAKSTHVEGSTGRAAELPPALQPIRLTR